jgi:hypothetical protein
LASSSLSVIVSDLPEDSNLTRIRKAAIVLKENHAMMFHPPTRAYKFVSSCTANAAMKLLV